MEGNSGSHVSFCGHLSVISANDFLFIKVLVGAMFAEHILIALKWGVCVCVCVFYKAVQVINYLFNCLQKYL